MGNNAQRVTGYKVKVSKNGRHWKWVDGGRVFRGNRAHGEAVVTQNFRKPVNARYVRLVVQTWSHHISMRSALKIGKGCTGRRRSTGSGTTTITTTYHAGNNRGKKVIRRTVRRISGTKI